ncbi:MAG TPA: polysaccharide deacetylase family protein, partial [Polyangia bacterium]|nr:polysaccharide deacetylase family protein [Polyangia bacterium]
MKSARSRLFTVRATLVVMGAGVVLAGFSGCAATCGCGVHGEGGGQAVGPAVATAPSAPRALAVGLPTPPGVANLPRPSGAPGKLKVLDWAGFKSAVSYTFDDGQPSQVEHYAELEATGVRLTFFVNSGSATWETGFVSTFSQAARDGHEIGNHTAHHCHADPDGTLHGTDRRAACPGASAAAELDDCTAFIRSKLGVPEVWTAASPFGDAGFASALGERFFLGRSATGGTVAPNDDTDPLALPMWGPAEHDGVAEFNAAVDESHTDGQWVIMLIHSIAPTTAAWFATVDIGAITGSISHAKSLGDVWIDSMANVGAYWRGQKVFTSVTPTTTQTTTQTSTQTWTWTLPAHFPPGRFLRVKVDGGTLSQRGQPLPWNG